MYRENASVFRAWWELLEPPTEFTAAWVAVHDRSRREIGKVIREGQDRGTINSDVDADITAELIVAAFERPVYSRMVLGWEQEYSDEQLVGLMSHLLGSERLG